eukprot:3950954-Pyramimonas_sp.AAC.1
MREIFLGFWGCLSSVVCSLGLSRDNVPRDNECPPQSSHSSMTVGMCPGTETVPQGNIPSPRGPAFEASS